jgi:hypothetical protein
MAESPFDWVAARAECTPHKMLIRLLAGVRADVESRNALRVDSDQFKFSVVDSPGEFTVVLESSKGVKRVRFVAEKAGIGVTGDTGVAIQASMRLDGGGDCMLHDETDGDWMSEWMFRQKALGKLFFG